MTEKIIMSFTWRTTKQWMKWTLTPKGCARLTTESDRKGRLQTKASVDNMRKYFSRNDVACVMYFNPLAYARLKDD